MAEDIGSRIDHYIDDHLENSLAELTALCAIPTVSARGGPAMQQGAEFVAKMLRKRGLAAEVHATNGHPIVFGERRGKGDKTLLFYLHYDVQPPEPLELWESPPFEPTSRDGKLFARGVSDDKGHIQCRVSAIDAVLAAHDGELPCTIKFVIEGEEETSSDSIPGFIERNKELLAADACIWEFGGVNYQGTPVQYLGMRGICYVELSVETGTLDAHSGLGGSIFPNAAWRLTWALASLKGPDERIRIPGFYDAVKEPSARDLALLAELPEVAEDLKRTYGIQGFLKGLQGGVELRREEVFVPTCTICGLTAGYQGPGSKTVLPVRASAKVDFRLVPDQRPEDVLRKLRTHLDAEGFEDVKFTYLGGEPPARTDPDEPFVQMVVKSAEEVYGVEQLVNPMIGGSGPNHVFIEQLKLPIATAGIGYPGAQAHAPNENMQIDHFVTGTKHTARVIEGMGRL